MKVLTKLALAALIATQAPGAAAQAEWSENEQQILASVQRGFALAEDEPAQAESVFREVIAAPSFNGARPEVQSFAYRGLGAVLLNRAREVCVELLPITDRLVADGAADVAFDAIDQRLAFHASAACNDHPRRSASLTALAQRHPDGVSDFSDIAIVHAAQQLDDPDVLRFFVDGAWTPRDATTDRSRLRLQLARLYASRGEIERARETAQALVVATGADINSIVVLFAEKVFAPVIALDPETFEFQSILDWQLANIRATAEGDPSVLGYQNDLAEALLLRGRKPEALAVVDAAIARMETASANAPAFVDQENVGSWTYNVRSHILAAMGSTEESLAALQRGVESGERGGQNVSQLLNRSADLVRLGRGAEALTALDAFGPTNASPYGQMVALRVRTCASAQVGDHDTARATLAEMRARETDSLVQVRSAALCLGDMDLAASVYIRILNDPVERISTIVALQDFIDDEAAYVSDYDRAQRASSTALRERADVQAAIEQVTIRRSFPIRSP